MQHYFVSKEDNYIYFQEEDIHHIIHVMRYKNNDQIIGIVEGEGHYLASLMINSKQVVGKIIKKIDRDNDLKADVILVCALLKGDKFELALQKACELGVKEIYPYQAKRSIVKIDQKGEDKKIARWQKIVKEAAEQSERITLPKVQNIIKLDDLIKIEADVKLLAYERESETSTSKLYNILNHQLDKKKIVVVIGPEGGFDNSEIKKLLENGFESISLGKRILRAETAAISLLSTIAFMLERGI